MSAIHELKVSRILATVLSNHCRKGDECPAEESGLECPFYGVLCNAVTPEKWHVWALLKGELPYE